MATLEAMLAPKALLAPKAFAAKGKDPEQLLIDFDLYIKTVNNYLLAVEKDGASNKVKLATLQALGGPDMVDLLEQVGKVILVDTPAIEADEANGIQAVDAIPGDTYEQGIEKWALRNGEWSQEVFKQAKRCDWEGYDAQKAARDAILYQTKDSKLRKKILAENLSFEQTVQWGRTNETSAKKVKDVEDVAHRLESEGVREEIKRVKEEPRQFCERRCVGGTIRP